MCGDVFNAEYIQIIDRCTQTDCAGHVRCASFELVGELVVSCFLKGDRTNHVSTALIRWHCVQQAELPVEHSHAHETIHLVTGKGVEITVEIAHIDFDVRHSQ